MIPLRLSLRNFMCYRDNVPILLLEGIQVVCLCGDNGHGKSALLDAMTWALWGKARAQSDDELIHIGQSEMEVELEFIARGQRYRVLRKRSKGKPGRAGQSILELQVSSSQRAFKPITANTLRETQERIIELLRMDYQTFINSAFLLQGRADEFTTKPPGERKRILGEILGLSFYDELESRAKELGKEREDRLKNIEQELQSIEQELEHKEEYEAQFQESRAALSTLEEQVKTQEEEFKALQASKVRQDAKRGQLEEMEKRIHQAQEEIASLERQTKERSQRIQEYQGVLDSYGGKLAQLQSALKEIGPIEETLKAKRGQMQELSNEIHYLKSHNSQLKKDMEELKEKIDLLSKGEAKCPLCETEIGVEGRDRVIAKYDEQGRDKGDYYRRNKAEADRKEGDLKVLTKETEGLEIKLTQRRSQTEKQMAVLEQERAQAEKYLPVEREALQRDGESLSRWQTNLRSDEELKVGVLKEVVNLEGLEHKLADVQRDLKALSQSREEARDQMMAAQLKVERCLYLEEERGRKRNSLKELTKERSIYADLTKAFGKKGIQALLIDSALPEIEQEANRLLGLITDYRMNIRIESQRLTQKGLPVETLDIKISDELGTRSYELYSGGEAFRINFALRIALSKLLARRAGAPLPTLFIDEGFGSQDNTGREKLVEAINAIRDEFERIIVITHIDELKEAFPVRIEVTKTPQGSTFWMA